MKNLIYHNGEKVTLTGKADNFMFEIEYESGATEFVHVDDLFFAGDFVRSKKNILE